MKIRDAIGKISFIAGEKETRETVRKAVLSAAKIFRGAPQQTRSQIEGVVAVAQQVDAETGSWIDPEVIAAGQGGAFDVCDMRHWLAIAQRASVPFVPAREILSLSESELSSIMPSIGMPPGFDKTARRAFEKAFPEEDFTEYHPEQASHDPSEIMERLFQAMESVPQDWMVRSNISGSSMLKSLAGTGLLDDGRQGATLAEGVEVGAGWVRVGNRTRIDATDKRFTDLFAEGHKDRLYFLARPWMQPGRWGEGEDPHRHGSIFAGKGRWPMEWRCFVEDGVVTGVASYYGWVGDVTPENVRAALEAKSLAERIVAEAASLGAVPRFMDMELLRTASDHVLEMRDVQSTLGRFPRDGISCTLDFIETDQGMMLLEGGPAHTPIGGGHPCAFAGHETDPRGICRTEGIALRLIDGVCLGNPHSWMGRRNDGSILSLEEAEQLAQAAPQSGLSI